MKKAIIIIFTFTFLIFNNSYAANDTAQVKAYLHAARISGTYVTLLQLLELCEETGIRDAVLLIETHIDRQCKGMGKTREEYEKLAKEAEKYYQLMINAL